MSDTRIGLIKIYYLCYYLFDFWFHIKLPNKWRINWRQRSWESMTTLTSYWWKQFFLMFACSSLWACISSFQRKNYKKGGKMVTPPRAHLQNTISFPQNSDWRMKDGSKWDFWRACKIQTWLWKYMHALVVLIGMSVREPFKTKYYERATWFV